MPKVIKDHPIIIFVLAIIIVLYIAAPTSGIVDVLRQIFSFIFGHLLAWFG